MAQKPVITLDGESLTPEILVSLGSGNYNIAIAEVGWDRINKGRSFIEKGITVPPSSLLYSLLYPHLGIFVVNTSIAIKVEFQLKRAFFS